MKDIFALDALEQTPHMDYGALPRTRFNDLIESAIFHYVKKKQPTGGAREFAFETFGLPESSPIGAGILVSSQIQATQMPQFVYGQALVSSGLGALQTGQITLQPLFNANLNF